MLALHSIDWRSESAQCIASSPGSPLAKWKNEATLNGRVLGRGHVHKPSHIVSSNTHSHQKLYFCLISM